MFSGLLRHQRERLGPRGTGGDTGEGSRHNVLKEMSWDLAGGGTLRAGQWLWGFQVVSSGSGRHDEMMIRAALMWHLGAAVFQQVLTRC